VADAAVPEQGQDQYDDQSAAWLGGLAGVEEIAVA
jgi:hypothetical protein